MLPRVLVTVGYEMGHSYDFEYEYDPALFCPSCGTPAVWVEVGQGDYYQGPAHVCISCGSEWTMPYLGEMSDKAYDSAAQVVEQIRHII